MKSYICISCTKEETVVKEFGLFLRSKQREDQQKGSDQAESDEVGKDKHQSKTKEDRREKEDSVGREDRPSASCF